MFLPSNSSGLKSKMWAPVGFAHSIRPSASAVRIPSAAFAKIAQAFASLFRKASPEWPGNSLPSKEGGAWPILCAHFITGLMSLQRIGKSLVRSYRLPSYSRVIEIALLVSALVLQPALLTRQVDVTETVVICAKPPLAVFVRFGVQRLAEALLDPCHARVIPGRPRAAHMVLFRWEGKVP